jgi:hypothetical protein
MGSEPHILAVELFNISLENTREGRRSGWDR